MISIEVKEANTSAITLAVNPVHRHDIGMRYSVTICLILSLGVGCGPRRADPAEQAVQALVGALYRNDIETALKLLTDETRVQLATDTGDQKTLPERLETRLNWRYERPVHGRPRVVQGRTSQSRRIVEYEMGGTIRHFPVLRVGAEWKVSLAEVAVVKPSQGAPEGALD